ncbi:Laminin subunit alpha-2 [Dissostichus eleginoides]|uniref:Laminin subunit alpha-2 n=1 Tax=Dissostichus eleginoides TaxID=100907 RepID=A0AAD9BWZ6_DISEL|nr:Laminin subunit alpha-2 [Dissostichus eleginoides]
MGDLESEFDLVKELKTNTAALEIERQNMQPQYQEAQQNQDIYDEEVAVCKDLERTRDDLRKELVEMKSVIEHPKEYLLKHQIKLKKGIMQDNEAMKKELHRLKERLRLLGIPDEAHEIAKVDTEDLIKGNKDLQSEIDNMTVELKSKTYMKEKYTALKVFQQDKTREKEALQKELLVADPECNGMTNVEKEKALKAKEDTVSRENEALQREMQEIERELEKEEALREKYNAAKQAVEVKSCETEALREKLECLKTKHQDLKRENDNVKENIKELELQREFKDSYLELEAFEDELRAEYKVLSKTHAEVHERVLKEEQWKGKHDRLKRQTDAIELHHDGLRKEIQSFRDRPKTLSDFQADVKTIQKEKKALLKLAESMVRELRGLKKVHIEMQPVEKQIQSIRSQNIYLAQWIGMLCDRIRTETRLSDELNIVNAQNKDLSDQRDACLEMLEEKKDSRSQS